MGRKKSQMRHLLLTLFLVLNLEAFDATIFPKEKEGFKQNIINLEPKDDESRYKVEVWFGKVLKVDCNARHFINDNLKENILSGYGYSYYEFSDENSTFVSTKMFCPKSSMKDKFVTFSNAIKTNYNSKIPLIIYTPKDIKLKLKIYELKSEEIL